MGLSPISKQPWGLAWRLKAAVVGGWGCHFCRGKAVPRTGKAKGEGPWHGWIFCPNIFISPRPPHPTSPGTHKFGNSIFTLCFVAKWHNFVIAYLFIAYNIKINHILYTFCIILGLIFPYFPNFGQMLISLPPFQRSSLRGRLSAEIFTLGPLPHIASCWHPIDFDLTTIENVGDTHLHILYTG